LDHTFTKMGTSRAKLLDEPSPSRRKSIRQKRDRRKTSLMKKSFEYSMMCGADVCLGIRIRDTGRVYIFSADASGFWAFVGSNLVNSRHMHIHPKANSFRTAIIHPQVKLLRGTSITQETTRCLWLSRGPNLKAWTSMMRPPETQLNRVKPLLSTARE
jgi:hypothetical protein